MSGDHTENSTTPMVNSVLHATKILEYYASQREEYLSLTEISQATKMHKTTVYRILRTLQSVGWIEQSDMNGKYRLGTGILLVASAVSVHNTTRGLISEEMHKLSDLYNETIVLSALRGSTGICVDMLKSRHSLSIVPENGYIVPLHLGATGKTLLSAQDSGTIEKILEEFDDEASDILKNQLEEIKTAGYCISESEVDQGVAAVSVPLVMKEGVYTLSISGPVERMQQLGYENMKNSLQEAVERIRQKESVLSGI